MNTKKEADCSEKYRKETRDVTIQDFTSSNKYFGYNEAFEKQLKCHRAVVDGQEQDCLLLLEHAPVITIGRTGSRDNVLVSDELLEKQGVEITPTNRGGDVTYHGPGQLVGYPIIDLKKIRKDVHWYLRMIEDVIVRTLARFDLKGERNPGFTGVWVNQNGTPEKVAAIGVAITKWVTFHGFALNVDPNFDHFNLIVPCGLHGKKVTSLTRLLGRKISMEEVIEAFIPEFNEIFEFSNYKYEKVTDVH